MNKVIKKLKNGDFKVVNASYNLPITYEFNRMRKRLERGRNTTNAPGYCYEHSIHRNNGS